MEHWSRLDELCDDCRIDYELFKDWSIAHRSAPCGSCALGAPGVQLPVPTGEGLMDEAATSIALDERFALVGAGWPAGSASPAGKREDAA